MRIWGRLNHLNPSNQGGQNTQFRESPKCRIVEGMWIFCPAGRFQKRGSWPWRKRGRCGVPPERNWSQNFQTKKNSELKSYNSIQFAEYLPPPRRYEYDDIKKITVTSWRVSKQNSKPNPHTKLGLVLKDNNARIAKKIMQNSNFSHSRGVKINRYEMC